MPCAPHSPSGTLPAPPRALACVPACILNHTGPRDLKPLAHTIPRGIMIPQLMVMSSAWILTLVVSGTLVSMSAGREDRCVRRCRGWGRK
jgi:hypothetical protein